MGAICHDENGEQSTKKWKRKLIVDFFTPLENNSKRSQSLGAIFGENSSI